MVGFPGLLFILNFSRSGRTWLSVSKAGTMALEIGGARGLRIEGLRVCGFHGKVNFLQVGFDEIRLPDLCENDKFHFRRPNTPNNERILVDFQ